MHIYIEEVKVKLPFNKSWEKYVDFVNSNFLFTFVHSNFSQV